MTALPYLGPSLVVWVWGGFSVNGYTLGFFYSLHFVVPFVILALAGIHILLLHETGSSSKLERHSPENKIKLGPSFLVKDGMRLVVGASFVYFVLAFPFAMGDPENFIEANPLSSPLHIQPE